MRILLKKNIQQFHGKEDNVPRKRHGAFNFRRIWLLSFLLTSGFSIVPVIFFAVIDYNVTERLMLSDTVSRTSRLTSNTWRSVAFFLNERQNALQFIVGENSFEDLNEPHRLEGILENLRNIYGGFTDLGVIDSEGLQRIYVGPYSLMGKNYSGHQWFENVVSRGIFISDVFLGFRNLPHLVIAIKHKSADGRFYVLRATIEHNLTRILSEINTITLRSTKIDSDRKTDIFLINRDGILQTESPYFGKVLDKIAIPVPGFSDETKVVESHDLFGANLIVGYRYIPETPFILMIVKDKDRLMQPWRQSRLELIQYLAISITIIMLWILGITTYFIRRLKETDRRRVKYLHMAEYSNKLASIGRLAAGVAHEINNPLAIINEKAGLVKDIFHFKKEYQDDPRLMGTMDAILNSVERCSRITRQLLNFARHMNVSVQQINLKSLVHEVLGFLTKEAEYRSIDVVVDIEEDIPDFESDRGKLQQILLNIVNNSFAAMTTGGSITIRAKAMADARVQIEISDTGCGISQENLRFIFEPFFSTKTEAGGTGLGLSITYSLAKELGGRIEVESKLGKGTTFMINLPMKLEKKEQSNASTAGG
jgi:two-component system, NtrC family, sensor kinase